MARISGFPPVALPGARILILGSMPSTESLARQRYYAHPRNAFWPIITSILGIESEAYDEWVEQVAARGVAVWDVLRDCHRPGSLDSDIDEKSAVTNDFGPFFRDHPGIGHIYFNGAKAESIYLRRVLPALDGRAAAIPRTRLPSTSPANAVMSIEQKETAWRIILEKGLKYRS